MTVYYIQPNNGTKTVTSFKKVGWNIHRYRVPANNTRAQGFRMIVGDPMIRSFNESSPEANNLNFRCLGPGGTNGGVTGAPGTDSRDLPAKPCEGGIRAQIIFPS